MNQIERVGQISAQDLMVLGLQQVAYIKAVVVDGRALYAVHAADGREIAMMASREVAQVAVRQNDLEPVSVH